MYSFNNLAAGGTGWIADVVVCAVLVLAALVGVKRGFLGMLVGFLSGILTLVLATLLCRPLATGLGSMGLGAKLSAFFTRTFSLDQGAFGQTLAENCESVIKGLSLPSFIKDSLTEAATAALADGQSGTLGAIVADGLTNIALVAIAWIGLFVVLTIVFAILKRFVRIFNKLPLIGAVNKILGAVLSLVVGAAIIVVVMYLFILLSSFLPRGIVDYVQSSAILGWLYNANPLAKILTALFN